MNIVIISGNLTRDIELRYAPSGTAVAWFNVAVNDKYKDRNGELKEEVSFIGCTAFGKQAEVMAQYLKKGSGVLIHGRLKQESWEKDGKKQSKTGVTVERWEFMGGRPPGEARAAAPASRPQTADMPSGPGELPPPADEDDVPF